MNAYPFTNERKHKVYIEILFYPHLEKFDWCWLNIRVLLLLSPFPHIHPKRQMLLCVFSSPIFISVESMYLF